MSAQYLNILINEKFVYPIKVYINSNNILKSEYTENNNIVINNDLFQLYKPSYKLIISNKDLSNLYNFIIKDINYIFKTLFTEDNLKKLLKVQVNSNNINSFQKALDYTSLNYVHVDSFLNSEDLSFDKVYRFNKTGFLVNINNKSWNLLFIINDYSKITSMNASDSNDTNKKVIKLKTGIDLQMLRSQTDVIPKILIEDDEMNFDQPQDLKPEFEVNYKNLTFINDDDDINIIIMDKNSKHRV
jgi:hypothetical protein